LRAGFILLDEELYSGKNSLQMSAQNLAFVGDAVFELVVREKLVSKYKVNTAELNKIKVSQVCCEAQSNFFEKIKDILTSEELEIYKRGRNAHVNKVPKKATPVAYHRATGVEALFGFLYLNGDSARLKEIAEKINL
jgi:ribonuclease-3 family protein